MPESLTRLHPSQDDELQQRRVFGKNFFVHLAGKTNGAHGDVINYLKSIGKVQVESYAESDFLMVFCPVVSKVGTDIEAALSNNSVLTDGKPAVLVVMHHTFDPHHLVAESRRQVNDARVWLTVDCLFYQKNLLPCPLNDIMQKQVADFLGSSSGSLVPFWPKMGSSSCSQVPFWKNTTFRTMSCSRGEVREALINEYVSQWWNVENVWEELLRPPGGKDQRRSWRRRQLSEKDRQSPGGVLRRERLPDGLLSRGFTSRNRHRSGPERQLGADGWQTGRSGGDASHVRSPSRGGGEQEAGERREGVAHRGLPVLPEQPPALPTQRHHAEAGRRLPGIVFRFTGSFLAKEQIQSCLFSGGAVGEAYNSIA
uniref:uncharacterized protein LOC120808266 isoform X2 n=1 Tax=Gasterosteus aculeatus aculeatus TaxID=481459 RepID=UPI001A97E0EE|nr:uncharacterized protein LOC120808266 isoform X2 [Gasterosteus aculeatus aculeatus]